MRKSILALLMVLTLIAFGCKGSSSSTGGDTSSDVSTGSDTLTGADTNNGTDTTNDGPDSVGDSSGSEDVNGGNDASDATSSEDADDVSSPDTSGTGCKFSQGLQVWASLYHDAKTTEVKDSVYVRLTDGKEVATNCPATVYLVEGSNKVTLQKTGPGTYEGGYSETTQGLPAVTLTPATTYKIEVDIDSNGSIDATGTVTMANVTNFKAVDPKQDSVTFLWADNGALSGTTYYVQASDKQDFILPDNFATGYTTGSSIDFGGVSSNKYFTVGSGVTCYARIQAYTEGSLDVPGRIEAWEYPKEPIVTYSW